MLLENNVSTFFLPLYLSPSLPQWLINQFSAPQLPCRVSRDNTTKCLLPRRTRKMDVHVYKVALSDLRKTASEKYCSRHDY